MKNNKRNDRGDLQIYRTTHSGVCLFSFNRTIVNNERCIFSSLFNVDYFVLSTDCDFLK